MSQLKLLAIPAIRGINNIVMMMARHPYTGASLKYTTGTLNAPKMPDSNERGIVKNK